MTTITGNPIIIRKNGFIDSNSASFLQEKKNLLTYLSIVKVKETTNLSHYIQRITFDLHPTHHDHTSGNAARFFLRHLGRSGKRIAIYRINLLIKALTVNLELWKLNSERLRTKGSDKLVRQRLGSSSIKGQRNGDCRANIPSNHITILSMISLK